MCSRRFSLIASSIGGWKPPVDYGLGTNRTSNRPILNAETLVIVHID